MPSTPTIDVTLQYADEYFSNRLNADAWGAADAGIKLAALVTASNILDTLDWIGVAVDAAQLKAFPRTGTFFDPTLKLEVAMSPAPDRFKRALCEQALHLLSNPDVLEDSGSVIDASIGKLSVKTIMAPSLVPQLVKKLAGPMMANGGNMSRAVWRAN